VAKLWNYEDILVHARNNGTKSKLMEKAETITKRRDGTLHAARSTTYRRLRLSELEWRLFIMIFILRK